MKNRPSIRSSFTLGNLATALSVLLILSLSLFARYRGLKFISWDLRNSVFPWYEYISQHGLWVSLKGGLSNYTPPYMYLLGLAALTRPFLNRISGIKLISLAFDVYNAFIIFQIVRLKYREVRIPLLAASLAFLLPTVIGNSAYWGQVDAMYTAFLLTCLLFLLLKRPGWAMLFFSLAFASKLQSIFLLPFLALLTFRKQIPWKHYLLIPLVYLVLVLLAALAGRPWHDLLTIYVEQAGTAKLWVLNAANPYIFMPDGLPDYSFYVAMFLAAGLLGLWIFFSFRRTAIELPDKLLLAALASAMIMPFVLPRMHDRYFYLADVLTLVVAFYIPRLWFLPLLLQAGSLPVYYNFLMEPPNKFQNLEVGLVFNTIAVTVILWYQFRRSRPAAVTDWPPQPLDSGTVV